MTYNFSFDYFFDAFPTVLLGLGATLEVTFLSFILAFLFAILLSAVSMVKNRAVQLFYKFWLSLFRGTPLLVQLFLFIYGVFPLIPGLSSLSLLWKAIICLALAFSAYMSETIRGAILSVDRGQMEACRTVGMTTLQAYIHVVLPQAFRLAIPSLMNNFIECFKGSAQASMVGVTDMMLRAKMLTSRTLRYIEGYLCVMILYWVLNMIFTAFQKLLERKLSDKY